MNYTPKKYSQNKYENPSIACQNFNKTISPKATITPYVSTYATPVSTNFGYLSPQMNKTQEKIPHAKLSNYFESLMKS